LEGSQGFCGVTNHELFGVPNHELVRENNGCIQSQVRMLKPTHKRPRAGEAAARGWVGVPSHVLGFLLGQHFARPGFADCLCLSLYQSFVVVLAADLVSQKSSVSAKR